MAHPDDMAEDGDTPAHDNVREPELNLGPAPDAGSGLEAAALKLDEALGRLEVRLSERLARATDDSAAHADRARLAADLDAARARERALELVAAEASEALGRAAAEVRAALAAELAGEMADQLEQTEAED